MDKSKTLIWQMGVPLEVFFALRNGPVTMKNIHHRFATPSLALATVFLLGACNTYDHVTSYSPSQNVPTEKGLKTMRGYPDLRLPARMGILTSRGFRGASLGQKEIARLQQSGIHSVLSVDSYVSDEVTDGMADMMRGRARIIEETRHLDLDIILLCDQTSHRENRQHMPPLQILSLGIVNPESTSTRTQLDVVLMDARNGYIYGAIGDESTGSSVSLTFLEAEIVQDAGEKRAAVGAKRRLFERFPAFWEGVKGRYGQGHRRE